jgi:hypothetical protein
LPWWENVLPERPEDHVELLLEQLAIGVLVEQGRSERLHLARLVASPRSENDPPPGHDVRDRIVLGKPNWVPDRQNVEGAAELQPRRLGREPGVEQDQVREHLVPLALEVVLGRPEAVEASFVHQLRKLPGSVERLDQPFVRIAPLVCRLAVTAHVVEFDEPNIER